MLTTTSEEITPEILKLCHLLEEITDELTDYEFYKVFLDKELRYLFNREEKNPITSVSLAINPPNDGDLSKILNKKFDPDHENPDFRALKYFILL